ncbi:hypothetical protein HBA54_08600 [Pelagibius litoralis]|uniref:Uncharacterized protein n=1 Tax=Pelagibius litoralis TaxID=374515 RepID=A0A967C4Q9_9PROT|nr:DUF5765 domain-containing protein [Pelagibius litoralis]NIA68649.1 hypothetical protein [Pelagibius litoralis]
MCWGMTASVTMVGVGTIGAVVLARRREPKAIWLTLGYFSAMEALQASGYLVIDQCGSPANRAITLLSYLHIVFQPFFINAFAMELVPGSVRRKLRRGVYLCCALSAAVMLAQLYPLPWAGACRPGTALCGSELCLVAGEWHIGWSIPYNGLLLPFEDLLGLHAGFPTYMLAAFLLPLAYGAWRFVVFHAMAGPLLAATLTDNPFEQPAIWCLFSIGILLISLSPLIRRQFEATTWWAWPKSWYG